MGSLQESLHLPPPPLISLGRLSRVLPARLLLPAFLSSPSLSSPHSESHFTHLQPDGLLTGVTSSTTSSFAPRRQAAWCPGTSLNSWSQLQQRERQWQRAQGYRRRPTPLMTQIKTTETEARSTLATDYACTFQAFDFRQNLDSN